MNNNNIIIIRINNFLKRRRVFNKLIRLSIILINLR